MPLRLPARIEVEHDPVARPARTIEDEPLWQSRTPDQHSAVARKALGHLVGGTDLPKDSPAPEREPLVPGEFHSFGHNCPKKGSSPPAPHFAAEA